jgi:DivIVA domain-containing protein
MAASFPRPDPSSPASIAEASFNTSRRGYSVDEVKAFLKNVSAEVARLQERERQLLGELSLAKSQPPQVADLDDEAMTRIVGDETVRVLQTARESAALIRMRAEENASRLVSDANDEVNRLRNEIDLEISRKRKDSISDAEAEVAMAKQQGREMVNEARAYRERVLSDLDRRTKLARHQIEELAHGRDRLLQVFERARLVAVDVTSELQALDGPTELVNLAPTTGPVPLMVPRQSLSAADELEPDDATAVLERSALYDGQAETPDADPAPPNLTGVDVDISNVDVEVPADDIGEGEDADQLPIDDTVAEFPDTVNVVLAADDALLGDSATDDSATDDSATDDSEVNDGAMNDAVIDDLDDVGGVDADAAVPVPQRNDGNVVSLFRGREPEPSDDSVATDEGAPHSDAMGDPTDDAPTAAIERTDVGGIFERLRHAQETVTEADPQATPDGEADNDLGVEPVDDVSPTVFSRRDEALVPLIVGAARKLKRVLADEQNGVLDALRSNVTVTSVDALLPSTDDHAAPYLAALDDDMILAAVAGAGEVGVADTVALHKTLRKSKATAGARDVVRASLAESLRHRLARCVSDGGGDNADVTRRVRAVYREWKTQHIDDQLDDVFRSAYAGGLTAMIEPGTSVIWSVDPNSTGCADCEDNSLAGAITVGSAFPTGHLAAPAHPGCRCLTLPASQ